MRIPLACCLLFFLFRVVDVDLSLFFLLFLPFFDFDLDSVCFHRVFFLWVLYYTVSSVSVFAATCLAYDIYWYAS